MSLIKITTWYLDYQGPQLQLPQWPQDVVLTEAELPSPEFSQFLFCAVGHHWRWFSRLSWDYQQWLDYVSSAQVRTFVLYQQGTPAGFVELRRHDDLSVELKFFGLLPAFIGKGLGKMLAQAAIALAQQWQTSRVWLHTCSEDHPSALKTYQQAGFSIVSKKEHEEKMPDDYPEAALASPYVWSRLNYFHTK